MTKQSANGWAKVIIIAIVFTALTMAACLPGVPPGALITISSAATLALYLVFHVETQPPIPPNTPTGGTTV